MSYDKATQELLWIHGYDPRSDTEATRQAQAELFARMYPHGKTRQFLILIEGFVNGETGTKTGK